MREFDLAAAKAGVPVCTRSGLEARIICYDRRGDSDCRMVALVNAGYEERVQYYSQAGKIIHNNTCADDLMMRDDDYTEKLARGEYGPTVKGNLTVQDSTVNEFEKFEGLREYIVEMASTGRTPAEWSGFIGTLNAALRMADNHNPACKESLQVDREYWRRVYAGQIMPVVFHAAITTGAKVKDEYKDMPAVVAIARSTITLADALLAELEKK